MSACPSNSIPNSSCSLALVPVRRVPEVAHRRHVRVLMRTAHLNRDGVVPLERIEVVDGLELRQVVDARQATKVVERQLRR